MSGFWPAWNQPSNTRSSSAVDFSECRSSTMTRSCFMETSGLIAVTISVSRERRSASSVTANASCSRAVKPSPLPPSSLRHFLSKGVNHSAAASRGPISMRACRYSSASRSASRSSAGRTWAMVPVISIGPFRGFLFGHHPPVMPAGAATEGVDRDDPTRMPDGTLVGPSGMRGRSGARHGIGSEDGGHDMLVVAEPPSPLPRGPCPRAMRAAKEQCHALQAHGPGPRSARRWRRVCRAAPPEAFSPQSAGATRRPQPCASP